MLTIHSSMWALCDSYHTVRNVIYDSTQADDGPRTANTKTRQLGETERWKSQFERSNVTCWAPCREPCWEPDRAPYWAPDRAPCRAPCWAPDRAPCWAPGRAPCAPGAPSPWMFTETLEGWISWFLVLVSRRRGLETWQENITAVMFRKNLVLHVRLVKHSNAIFTIDRPFADFKSLTSDIITYIS